MPLGVSRATTWLNLITIGCCAPTAAATSRRPARATRQKNVFMVMSNGLGGEPKLSGRAIARFRGASALGRGHRPEIACLLHRIESPTGIDQRVDAGRVEDRRAQAAQLRLEIRVAHRPLETADRMLYALLDDRAVGEPDSHVRRGLSEFRVDARTDPVAQRNPAP